MRTSRSIAWLGIIALSLFFSLQVSSCSLIGMLIGFSVDQGVPKVRVIPPNAALEVSPGAHVAFHLKDSTTVTGLYAGVTRVPEETYARRYSSWRDSLPPGRGFPALGDSITMTWQSGKELAARSRIFSGFGYRQVLVASALGERPDGVPFENLVAISGPAGASIPMEQLVTLDISGELPSATGLRVVNGRDTSLTALDRVARVEIRTARHGVRNGFLIGLAMDALIVAIAVATYEPPSCELQGTPSTYGTGVRPLDAPFDVRAGRIVPRTDSVAGGATTAVPAGASARN